MSAVVPLTEPAPGGMVAALGMDVDALAWRRAVLAGAAAPTAVTLAGLVLLGVSALLAQSRRRILARQESLRESEEHHRRIAETITDYVYSVRITNGVAVATSHGPGCLAVTGYNEDEFARDPFLWLNIVPPEERDQVAEWSILAATGQSAAPIVHRIVRKDGDLRWVEDTPVLHRDGRGMLLGYDGLIHDITDRKRVEETLREDERRAGRQRAAITASR